jgi:hypothetical protein
MVVRRGCGNRKQSQNHEIAKSQIPMQVGTQESMAYVMHPITLLSSTRQNEK